MIDKRYFILRNREKLVKCNGFGDIFELVKQITFEILKLRRAGLSLYLAYIPKYILAYHIMGSNTIVMNKAILDVILPKKDIEYVNSYIFVVLLHEYLHSLGFYDEFEVRRLTSKIILEAFGEDHISNKMIGKELIEIFPEIKEIPIFYKNYYEVVRDFDKSNTTYIV